MIRKQKERKEEQDKETTFILRGRPVDQAKIERYKRDRGIDEDVEMDLGRSPAGMSSFRRIHLRMDLTNDSSYSGGYAILYSSRFRCCVVTTSAKPRSGNTLAGQAP